MQLLQEKKRKNPNHMKEAHINRAQSRQKWIMLFYNCWQNEEKTNNFITLIGHMVGISFISVQQLQQKKIIKIFQINEVHIIQEQAW